MSPRVDVVVPVRDGGRLSVLTATLGRRPQMLAEAAASVQEQTLPPLEHLVVDDGSWKRMARAGCRFVHLPQVTLTYRFHTDNLTYGGVDPERTRAVKELRDAAGRGEISWDDCARREAEVWS